MKHVCRKEILAVAPMHVDIYVDHIMVPRTSVQSSIDLYIQIADFRKVA